MAPEFENKIGGPEIEEIKQRPPILAYIVSTVLALAMILIVCGVNGLLTEQKSPQDTAKICCDAFFAAGVLMFGIGALMWSSSKGAFDGLGYTVSSMINLHKPDPKARLTWKKKETFEEYVERKHKKNGKAKFIPMLILGAIFIMVAVVCLIVYHKFD